MSADTDGTADFAEMYRAHYPEVLRFVRRRASPGQIEHVVAQTFLTAWRGRGELSHRPRVWLLRTAREVMLGMDRGAGTRSALPVRIRQWVDLAEDDDGTGCGEDRTALVHAWQGLTEADQEVLALHVWERLPDAEAAQVIGCTRIAYSLRLTLAGRRLASLMA
ncbi:RNA polymerase sigma factor [Streptomyces sp. YS415]|uniref:RNA polymerase sigma factor n=1 Tax=Streptomyces sp. YS415 TaxID=2944806 RepID=UPI0020223168|nr:RNA polymerase sigma factor [Streptomyces sp. YS415]MCL7429390.1 RNA polymerase sigma factor [Streptomyces sp. YS415]